MPRIPVRPDEATESVTNSRDTTKEFESVLARLLDSTPRSRREWSALLGITPAAISAWTTGKNLPRPEMLLAVLRIVKSEVGAGARVLKDFDSVASKPAVNVSSLFPPSVRSIHDYLLDESYTQFRKQLESLPAKKQIEVLEAARFQSNWSDDRSREDRLTRRSKEFLASQLDASLDADMDLNLDRFGDRVLRVLGNLTNARHAVVVGEIAAKELQLKPRSAASFIDQAVLLVGVDCPSVAVRVGEREFPKEPDANALPESPIYQELKSKLFWVSYQYRKLAPV
jgi:hypothetical protein